MKNKIILLLSGSLNPVHYGHLEMLIKAKEYMERCCNCTIVYAFLAPSSDKYVESKLGSEAISLANRNEMCFMIAKGYDWIKVFIDGIASGSKIASILSKQYKMDVYEIGGADFINRTKIKAWRKMICFARKGSIVKDEDKLNIVFIEEEVKDVSSTLIRKLTKEKKYEDVIEMKLTSQEIVEFIKEYNKQVL